MNDDKWFENEELNYAFQLGRLVALIEQMSQEIKQMRTELKGVNDDRIGN